MKGSLCASLRIHFDSADLYIHLLTSSLSNLIHIATVALSTGGSLPTEVVPRLNMTQICHAPKTVEAELDLKSLFFEGWPAGFFPATIA